MKSWEAAFVKTGLIVGSGMDFLVPEGTWQESLTPYGYTYTANINLGDSEVVLIRRHGPGLNVPPHLINYRANLWAMRDLGAQCVLSTAAVGSLRSDLKPGDLAVVHDFIDFTKRRDVTIYDKPGERVVHTDFTVPYCPVVSDTMERAASEAGINLGGRVVYVCVDGPRYETPAEIRMFAQWDGDVIGMTGVPEVVIARELGICYGSLAIVTNYAAGISEKPLSHQEVLEMVAGRRDQVLALLVRTISHLSGIEHSCVY